MELNITAFFAAQIAPLDLSASVAEIGQNAAADTWSCAQEYAQDLQLLQSPEQVEAFLEFAQASGGDFPHDTDWQALCLQWVASELRECGMRYSTDTPDFDNGSGAIYRGDDGQVYFYIEV